MVLIADGTEVSIFFFSFYLWPCICLGVPTQQQGSREMELWNFLFKKKQKWKTVKEALIYRKQCRSLTVTGLSRWSGFKLLKKTCKWVSAGGKVTRLSLIAISEVINYANYALKVLCGLHPGPPVSTLQRSFVLTLTLTVECIKRFNALTDDLKVMKTEMPKHTSGNILKTCTFRTHHFYLGAFLWKIQHASSMN